MGSFYSLHPREGRGPVAEVDGSEDRAHLLKLRNWAPASAGVDQMGVKRRNFLQSPATARRVNHSTPPKSVLRQNWHAGCNT